MSLLRSTMHCQVRPYWRHMCDQLCVYRTQWGHTGTCNTPVTSARYALLAKVPESTGINWLTRTDGMSCHCRQLIALHLHTVLGSSIVCEWKIYRGYALYTCSYWNYTGYTISKSLLCQNSHAGEVESAHQRGQCLSGTPHFTDC